MGETPSCVDEAARNGLLQVYAHRQCSSVSVPVNSQLNSRPLRPVITTLRVAFRWPALKPLPGGKTLCHVSH